MDARELREWQAYEAVTGWLGPRRGDYHAAMVAAAIMNALRDRKSRPIKPEKLLLWNVDQPERQEQTPEDMLRVIRAANRAMGGEEVRRGDPAGPRDPHSDQAGRRQKGPQQGKGVSR